WSLACDKRHEQRRERDLSDRAVAIAGEAAEPRGDAAAESDGDDSSDRDGERCTRPRYDEGDECGERRREDRVARPEPVLEREAEPLLPRVREEPERQR